MKISVVIPTYNSVKTIEATINSVLMQTVAPYEILILDDGSTDNTVNLLESFKPQVTVFRQVNRGVAHARNVLCARAVGDLVAFLDHDDIWHPKYLEVQSKLFKENPDAVAFITNHKNFYGYGSFRWDNDNILDTTQLNSEVILPFNFILRYNNSKGTFYSMSFCCIPKVVINKIGNEPFCLKVSGVDDCYICNILPIYGSVVYSPTPLVAYRIIEESQSMDQLNNFHLVVETFKLLEDKYDEYPDLMLRNNFKNAFAAKRRRYAKTLIGVGNTEKARGELWASACGSNDLLSILKSLSLLFLTFVPKSIQPTWPSRFRKLT